MDMVKPFIIAIIVFVITIGLKSSIAYAKGKRSGKLVREFKFFSGGPSNSHQLFARQALDILRNDKGYDIFKIIDANSMNIMLAYCDKPDEDETNIFFAYHFYNPFTKRNFLPRFMKSSKITGLTKFQEHMKNALNYYKKEQDQAMKELGRAIHFLEDINVPHHAANLIPLLSNHHRFENYVNKNNKKFIVETSSWYNKYEDKSFQNYCVAIYEACAKNSYLYKDMANSSKKEDLRISAAETTKFAQEIMASLIYRFLIEVKAIYVDIESIELLSS